MYITQAACSLKRASVSSTKFIGICHDWSEVLIWHVFHQLHNLLRMLMIYYASIILYRESCGSDICDTKNRNNQKYVYLIPKWQQNKIVAKKCCIRIIHPGRLTWNLQITHLERKMIFQTSMIMFQPLIFRGVFTCNFHGEKSLFDPIPSPRWLWLVHDDAARLGPPTVGKESPICCCGWN